MGIAEVNWEQCMLQKLQGILCIAEVDSEKFVHHKSGQNIGDLLLETYTENCVLEKCKWKL